jgi:hypothetical protein
MSPGFFRQFGAGFVVLALFAAAPPKEAGKETVDVSVLVILASESDKKTDLKLTCIAREVQKEHANLTGFQIVTMTKRSLAVGAKETFDLVGEQKAAIMVKRAADQKNRVEVKIAPPQMGEITYDTCCGKFLPIVTPYRTPNNDLLILAVRVQPCREK